MQMDLYMQNMQLDNQLYSKRNYDFPVVMLMQEPVKNRIMQALDTPIERLFETVTESSALKLSLTIDTWVDPRYHKVSGTKSFDIFFNSIYISTIRK